MIFKTMRRKETTVKSWVGFWLKHWCTQGWVSKMAMTIQMVANTNNDKCTDKCKYTNKYKYSIQKGQILSILYPNALLVIGRGWHLWKCFSIRSEKIKFLRQFFSRPEPCFACMAETVAVIPFPAKPLLLPAPTSSRPGTVGKNTLFLRTAEEREDKTGVGGKLEYRKALFLWNPQFLPLSSIPQTTPGQKPAWL